MAPHAETSSTTTSTMAEKSTQLVNGDSKSQSATIDHVFSYPLVSSGVSTFKSVPLGAQSLSILNQAYETLVAPLVSAPFTQDHIKPTVGPYISKADELGDSSLKTIDTHFPIVKSKPEELQGQIVGLAKFPFVLADKELKWVLGIYNDQYKKAGGNPKGGVQLIAATKALFGTGLLATSETLSTVASWLVETKKSAETEIKSKIDSK